MAGSVRDEGEGPIIVGIAEAAMQLHVCAIESLPQPDAKSFHARVDAVLAGLRKTQTMLEAAATRTRPTPSVIAALGEVRGRYDDLMTRAAAAPGSSLGQQLYVARRRAQLSIQEIATAVGLRADLLDALEAGQATTENEAVKVKELIAALQGSREAEAGPYAAQETPEGFDESAAWSESSS
jgi:ribosome-binding protein aMBF1 (putative translation factor)